MPRTAIRSILSLVIFLTLFSPYLAGAAATGTAKNKILQGSVTQSELIDTLEQLGIKCAVHDGGNPALVVQNVRLGSAAYYKGVAENDGIKGLVQENDHFNLTIQRSGK